MVLQFIKVGINLKNCLPEQLFHLLFIIQTYLLSEYLSSIPTVITATFTQWSYTQTINIRSFTKTLCFFITRGNRHPFLPPLALNVKSARQRKGLD